MTRLIGKSHHATCLGCLLHRWAPVADSDLGGRASMLAVVRHAVMTAFGAAVGGLAAHIGH